MTAASDCSRHRRFAAALAALGLLAGCGGGPERAGSTAREQPDGGAVAASTLQDIERQWAEDVERRWTARAVGPEPLASRGGAAADPAAAVNYRLNPGDVLQISVWREEELQRQVLVQPDGSISFPLVGQTIAAGRTAGEVEAEIARRLERFIPDAVATVELLEAKGNKIYIMGEVNRQGEYQMGGPLTVVQAISLAGGFTDLAAKDRIRVLREEDGEEVAFTVDYGRVASGRDAGSNLELEAGDTVIVPSKVLGLF